MVSKLPWRIDKSDPSIIYDADGELIAKDYKFYHIDDFEAIYKLVVKNNKEDKLDTILRILQTTHCNCGDMHMKSSLGWCCPVHGAVRITYSEEKKDFTVMREFE